MAAEEADNGYCIISRLGCLHQRATGPWARRLETPLPRHPTSAPTETSGTTLRCSILHCKRLQPRPFTLAMGKKGRSCFWSLVLKENPSTKNEKSKQPMLRASRHSLPPLNELVLPDVEDAQTLRHEEIQGLHGIPIDVGRGPAAHAGGAGVPGLGWLGSRKQRLICPSLPQTC